MKRILTLIILCAAAIVAQAQGKGYECTYQEKMDISQHLSKIDPSMRDAVAEFMTKRKSYYTLTFADGKSYYEKNQQISDDDFGMDAAPAYFVDFDKQEQTTVNNFFGRTFLINEPFKPAEWTFVNETRTIAGMNCSKAIHTDTAMTIEVWYSTQTPIPAGPGSCYGLPGLVVEVTVGPLTYTLTEIKSLDQAPNIKKPTKGKKVTQEEYLDIVKKKLEEMGLGNLGNGVQTFDIGL